MALYDLVWYANAGDQSTTGYYAVAKWAASTSVAAGVLRRQLAAPSINSERVFVCIVAGTTGSTEPAWTLTRGAKTTDNTATWMEVTGQASLNGDLTNTATWAQVKAVTPAVLGQVIKRSNNASYQICTTAGAMSASEPSFSDTAGTTTTDTTAVWTSLGVVGNFTGGQAPFARLASACATNWFAAGNTIYLGDNHAESQATTINIFPAGSAATIGNILCHNHSGSYPPASGNLMTGATISTTTAGILNWNAGGAFYVYGVTFKVGVGSSGVATLTINPQAASNLQDWACFDNCSFWSASTSSNSLNGFYLGNVNTQLAVIIFNNTTVKFGHANHTMQLGNLQFLWRNTGQILASGSSVPGLFLNQQGTNVVYDVVMEALDLSQLTGTLHSNATAAVGSLLVKDCKLNAAMTAGTPIHSGMTVQLVRCDSGATAYKSARYLYEGTETTETSITRVGGATDPASQAQSRKIVTTANAQWLRPFRAEPYAIWNATTGANVTVTVCGTINAGSLPNNDDIWLEVEYLSSSATPLGTIVTTTKSNLLATNAAVTSDASTWNGGGSGAGWSPFKLVAVLSSPQPGLAGYIHARIRTAKPSTTYYLDPQIVLT